MRRIAAIGILAVGLVGCGGEAKRNAPQPERAAAVDWRPEAERACGQLTDPLVSRAWFTNLREMRRRLPGTVRDVREAIADTGRLPGRPDQQFVADMAAVDPSLVALRRAGRAMNVRRLDHTIGNLERRLRTAARSSRRAGLRECVTAKQVRRIVNALRSPVAAEQVSQIVRRTNKRVRIATQDSSIEGLRDAQRAWAQQDAVVRNLKVPAWAKRERAAWLRAARHFADGLNALGDRYAAGLYTPDAQYDELVKNRIRRSNRALSRLYDAMGAHPTGLRI